MMNSAVVTGGGNGIGKALCLELSRRAYRVVVSDIVFDEAKATVREIEEADGVAIAVRCDVTMENDVKALVATTNENFGPPDIVFSNAGASIRKRAKDFTRSDWMWIFKLNVFGMMDVAVQFAQLSMDAHKSMRIVMTGSEYSIGIPRYGGSAASIATKHAVLGCAEALRIEWMNLPVDISILCPGLTKSRLYESQRHREGWHGGVDPRSVEVLNAGMPAHSVAKIAVDGAERGEFYIFTHSHAESYAIDRFDEISAAFMLLNKTSPTDRSYDIGHVVDKLMNT